MIQAFLAITDKEYVKKIMQMQDAIEYRAMDYYQRRYRERE